MFFMKLFFVDSLIKITMKLPEGNKKVVAMMVGAAGNGHGRPPGGRRLVCGQSKFCCGWEF
jgi:hypothetical protein